MGRDYSPSKRCPDHDGVNRLLSAFAEMMLSFFSRFCIERNLQGIREH